MSKQGEVKKYVRVEVAPQRGPSEYQHQNPYLKDSPKMDSGRIH